MTDNDDNDNNNNIKKIIIEDCQKNKIKKINCEKERKMRVETKTWELNEEELAHEKQLNSLQQIENIKIGKDKYISKLTSHIKSKLCSYRQQDISKKKLIKENFVTFEETIDLLNKHKLKCCYCSEDVYILYERVREMKQWSLDRVNNDIGHNSGNLVIACLECNLKRRRTNKDAFMFTKNMVIIKEGLNSLIN